MSDDPTYKLELLKWPSGQIEWKLLFKQPIYDEVGNLFEYVQLPVGHEYVQIDQGSTTKGRLYALSDAVVARKNHERMLAVHEEVEVLDFDE